MTLEILCNRTAGRLRILIGNVLQDRKCTVFRDIFSSLCQPSCCVRSLLSSTRLKNCWTNVSRDLLPKLAKAMIWKYFHWTFLCCLPSMIWKGFHKNFQSFLFIHRCKNIFTNADACVVFFFNRNETKVSCALPQISRLLLKANNSMTSTWYLAIIPARNIQNCPKYHESRYYCQIITTSHAITYSSTSI